MSTASILIRTARRRVGISQADLARRAQMPRSVVNAYERETRQPSAEALQRLLAAAGAGLTLSTGGPIDPQRAAHLLVQVLELAESLPFRRSKALTCTPFRERLARR